MSVSNQDYIEGDKVVMLLCCTMVAGFDFFLGHGPCLQKPLKDAKQVETAFKPRVAASTVRFAFSKCPFCIKAKKELDDMGVPYKALDLDQMDQEAPW